MRVLMILIPLLPAFAAPDDALEATPLELTGEIEQWYTAESQVEMSTAQVRPGAGPSVHWHVDVDHTAGEPNYPIGWPRTGVAPAKPWDWSRYDFYEFWVYAETSREALPATPLGLGLNMPDRQTQFNLTVPAVKDEWVHVRLPIQDLAKPELVARSQWHIAESNYQHGDSVDFYFSGIRLLRYTRPAAAAFRPLESVVTADAGYLLFQLDLAGIDPGADLPVELVLAGQPPAKATARRGRQRLVVPVDTLATGAHAVTLRSGGETLAETSLEVVGGPFGG